MGRSAITGTTLMSTEFGAAKQARQIGCFGQRSIGDRRVIDGHKNTLGNLHGG